MTSHFDYTLTFEFSTSFCQYLSVILFDLCHLFCKKVRLQGFIKKFIIPEPSEINNLFLLAKDLATFCVINDIFFMFHTPTAIFLNQTMLKTSFF
jgi:hypothetical protein